MHCYKSTLVYFHIIDSILLSSPSLIVVVVVFFLFFFAILEKRITMEAHIKEEKLQLKTTAD